MLCLPPPTAVPCVLAELDLAKQTIADQADQITKQAQEITSAKATKDLEIKLATALAEKKMSDNALTLYERGIDKGMGKAAAGSASGSPFV